MIELNREWSIKAEDDGQYAIAYALLAVARAIDRLGNADASTPMGGLEALGAAHLQTGHAISDALGRVADAIEGHGS